MPNHACSDWDLVFQCLTLIIIELYVSCLHNSYTSYIDSLIFSLELFILAKQCQPHPWWAPTLGAVCCSLPGLKHTEGDILALEIFQIVEEVKAHIPVAKQDMESVPSLFLELLFDIYLI